MWDWADQSLMCQEDLKSLDIFSFGLIWAGVLSRKSVITARDGSDPDALRLLEILRRVDQPTMDDLAELGYRGWVLNFARAALDNDRAALRASPRLFNMQFPDSKCRCSDEVDAQAQRLGAWVRANARKLPGDSEAPQVIEGIARFSYRKRPTAEEILGHPYFELLRRDNPELVPEIPEVECFPDAAAELHRQFQGMGPKEDPRRRRNRKVREALRSAHEDKVR